MREAQTLLTWLLRLLKQLALLGVRSSMILVPVVAGALIAALKSGVSGDVESESASTRGTPGLNDTTHPNYDLYWDQNGNPL